MSRWKKAIVAMLFVTAALVGVGVWSFASPWMALSSLRAAAGRGDAAMLNKLVDWDSVRDKLTIDLGRRALVGGGLSPNDERVTEVVLSIEALVGKMATAENMIVLFKKAEENGEKPLIKGAYLSMGTYIFAIENQGKSSAITVVLRRQGPASWRVVEIIMLDLKTLAGS